MQFSIWNFSAALEKKKRKWIVWHSQHNYSCEHEANRRVIQNLHLRDLRIIIGHANISGIGVFFFFFVWLVVASSMAPNSIVCEWCCCPPDGNTKRRSNIFHSNGVKWTSLNHYTIDCLFSGIDAVYDVNAEYGRWFFQFMKSESCHRPTILYHSCETPNAHILKWTRTSDNCSEWERADLHCSRDLSKRIFISFIIYLIQLYIYFKSVTGNWIVNVIRI